MRKMFEFSVMLVFVMALFFYNLQPTGMAVSSEGSNNIQIAPSVSTTKCGSACFTGSTIGIYDKNEQCIEIKKYYDEKRCCIDKDCPIEENCENEVCVGAAVQPPPSQYCMPTELKAGTECLVCNAGGTSYVQDDSKCSGGTCQSDGKCLTPIQICSDGTAYDQCSATKPKYCDSSGILRDNYCYGYDRIVGNSDDCGCDSGMCQNDGSCASNEEKFSISGAITDTNNAPLSNARIEVITNDEKLVASSTADNNGNYVISGVPAGKYIVGAGKSCYRNDGESIDLTGDLKVDFRLQAPVALVRVEIKPASSTTAVGQKILFSAEAYDSDNIGMPVDFLWSVDDTSTGVIGSVDRIHGDAEFEGKKVGSTNIRATATCGSNSESASASASVLSAGSFVLKKCSEADATTSTKVDYVVLPDESYRRIEDFKTDIKTKYLPSLFSTSPLDMYSDKFNIYYYEEKAMCDSTGMCKRPANLYKDCPFADIIGVIHVPEGMIPSTWRDYGVPGFFTAVTPRGQVHEIGHSLFDFADEYCCGGAYFEPGELSYYEYPYHNIFKSEGKCKKQLDDNAINKKCEKICNCIGPVCLQCVDWYKQEGDSIMGDHTKTDKFSENNILRINWFFANVIK